jgi:hypothetical protein
MTQLRRLDAIRLLAFGLVFALPLASMADQLPPLVTQMAKTYGLDSFDKVEAIRYTWAIEGTPISRTWEWHPKTDTVTYEGKDKEGKPVKVTYKRSEIDSQSDAVKNEIDPNFVNDQYWALLPFHFVWDGATVTDEGAAETPLGKTQAERIVAKYASSGYSPGDTWELYVGPDKRIAEMVYHRAVPVKGVPNLVDAKWEGYKKAGPLLFSTERPGTADGHPFRITVSDVVVKVKGSPKWIPAE